MRDGIFGPSAQICISSYWLDGSNLISCSMGRLVAWVGWLVGKIKKLFNIQSGHIKKKINRTFFDIRIIFRNFIYDLLCIYFL